MKNVYLILSMIILFKVGSASAAPSCAGILWHPEKKAHFAEDLADRALNGDPVASSHIARITDPEANFNLAFVDGQYGKFGIIEAVNFILEENIKAKRPEAVSELLNSDFVDFSGEGVMTEPHVFAALKSDDSKIVDLIINDPRFEPSQLSGGGRSLRDAALKASGAEVLDVLHKKFKFKLSQDRPEDLHPLLIAFRNKNLQGFKWFTSQPDADLSGLSGSRALPAMEVFVSSRDQSVHQNYDFVSALGRVKSRIDTKVETSTGETFGSYLSYDATSAQLLVFMNSLEDVEKKKISETSRQSRAKRNKAATLKRKLRSFLRMRH